MSILFLAVAWANPQWGNKKAKVLSKSADIFVLLDISQSMMTQDVSPNRLERSKRFAEKMVTELRGNRIGLVLFAGEAYLQMPLTSDYAATSLFLRTANTELAGTQGTAIGEAIALTSRAFQEDNLHHKTIIIISDGEDHDEQALSEVKEAYDQGIVTYTIGVGTEEGDYIPYTTPNGVNDFKRDEAGKLVKSQFNPDLLKNVANEGGGKYYPILANQQIIDDLKIELEKLDKREIEQKSFTDFASYFQYFIFFAIALLFIEFILSEKRKKASIA
ncbi:VWA domain-containing protein [Portibacter lacus]|uniref:Membrane protein n=1 Tax=Portibacter lacus TaxID=1099794 RepID=A0AA37SRZ8_9BACT|nr:VWA domain-containing protein [Portibacter lacus]GLR17030.1 membrane protein [Portibacter lacus]